MQHQPSSSVVNPSPLMQDHDGSSGGADGRNWPFTLVLFSFLGMLAGFSFGGIYFWQCPRVYKSEATLFIHPQDSGYGGSKSWGTSPDHSKGLDVRHDQNIGEDNILTKCLIKNSLNELPTLRDLTPTDQVKKIQGHLVVAQSHEEIGRYELEYTSLDPSDAQLVLATIVSTYDKHLASKYDVFISWKRAVAEGQFKEQVGCAPQGQRFSFQTVRPAIYGREVWPVLNVILFVSGLIGTLLGLGIGGVVALAAKTSR